MQGFRSTRHPDPEIFRTVSESDECNSRDLHERRESYLQFSFIAYELATLPAERCFTSTNIVAWLNLLNIQYDSTKRVCKSTPGHKMG